jgi:hypothetical protein
VEKGGKGEDDNASSGRNSPEVEKTAREVRSREEVATALAALTPNQRKQLAKAARYYGGLQTREELLQSAFHLVLEDGSDKDHGRRRCPKHVDIVTCLCGVMRSISHGEREKRKRRGVHVVINTQGQELAAVDPEDPHPGPGKLTDVRRTYCHIMSLFNDDPLARMILEGIETGLNAEQIRDRTGLSDVAYQSKRRQIRRVIDKAYPEGWQ